MSIRSLLTLKNARAPSIRTSLAALVVGCVLPIAVVAAFLIVNFYEREQTQLTMNAVSRALAMTTVVDREFASIQAALQALATSHRLATGDLGGFHARAVEALKNIPAEAIVVFDARGQLLLSTARPIGDPLPELSNPPLLKRTLETGKPDVSDLFVGPLSGHQIFTIAVPVARDGSIDFSLNATVAPAQMLRVLSEQKLPNSWIGAIADSSGSIVARTRDMQRFLGQKVTADLLQRLSISDKGALKTKTLEGIPVLTAYSKSSATRWTVVLGIPLAELTAGLRHTLAWLIVVTFAALGIGLALAWHIGGRLARSITALIEPAIALGSGTLLPIPHLHCKEANELGQALLVAATTLHQAQYAAHHDVLTGLANRALFHLVVNQQLALCRRNKTDLAILYIDLDGFKAVNDKHGHAAGDQLLRAVSTRIKNTIRDSDVSARLGGDEFAIAMIHSNLDNAMVFAGKLIDIVSAPYQLGAIEGKISASIGVAGYPMSATEVDTLLKNADHAMYRAKGLGKGRVCAATQ